MKKIFWIPLYGSVFFVSGCGSNPPADSPGGSGVPSVASTPKTSGGSDPSVLPGKLVSAPSDPKEVVQLFLDSMRQGNGAQLSALLSTLAREEIKRKELEIAPLGSPLAVFAVTEVAPQEGGMLVSSTWTEPDQPGQPATELEVVWELRLEPSGWRICGMAVDPRNGDEVQVVDFERLEPEPVAQDPQRVASLPNAPVGNLPPVGNAPGQSQGGFTQYGNVSPNALPPAGGNAPADYQRVPQPNPYTAGGIPQPNMQQQPPPPGNYPQMQLPPTSFSNSQLPPASGYNDPQGNQPLRR